MHVDHLSVSFVSTDRRRHDNQRILVHKVSYASFILRAVAMLCDQIELESEGKREQNGKDQ